MATCPAWKVILQTFSSTAKTAAQNCRVREVSAKALGGEQWQSFRDVRFTTGKPFAASLGLRRSSIPSQQPCRENTIS